MDSFNPQPPFLGQRQPDYPPLVQLLRVTGTTVPGPTGTSQFPGSSFPGPSLYVSFTQQLRTDTMIPKDREPCLVDDVNGGGLQPGFYLGRLAGSWTSLPVYEVSGGGGVGGGGGGLLAGDAIGPAGRNVDWGLTKVPVCNTLPTEGRVLTAIRLPSPGDLAMTLQAGGNLLPNVDYQYAISSVDATGEANANFTVDSHGNPLTVHTSPNVQTVKLTWTAVNPNNWIAYNIYRGPSSVFGDPSRIATVPNDGTQHFTFIDDGSVSPMPHAPLAELRAPGDPLQALEWCPQSIQQVFNYYTLIQYINYFITIINSFITETNNTYTVNNNTYNYYSTIVNYFSSSVVSIINSFLNINNSKVTVTNNSIVNFGISVSSSVPPPGVLSKPTQQVTGAPTWVPQGSYYPLLWNAYDHIEWEWDGFAGEAGSSAAPGGGGWVPFVSVGRTPVNDANYTAVTRDRVIAYTNITADRVVTLPPAASVPPGFTLRIVDESGKCNDIIRILAIETLGDQVNGGTVSAPVVVTPFGAGIAVSNGVSDWTVPPSGADGKLLVSRDDTTRDYLENKLTSGDGSITFAEVSEGGNEKLDIRSTGGGTPTLASGQTINTTVGYSVTNAFANVGVNLTLPNIGKYLITAVIQGTLIAGTVGDTIQVRLRDSTTPAVVPGTTFTMCEDQTGAVGVDDNKAVTISVLLTTTATNRVIDVQAICASLGATTKTVDQVTMLYVQIG